MTKKAGAKDRYHHGALREALIKASDEILAESGVETFSLREAARRAGVSPAAPAYHFGNVQGLLTEVAVRGYQEFARLLREGAEAGGSVPQDRLRGLGEGYVRFAITYPGRFHLMFRKERLFSDDPRLVEAGVQARHALEATVRSNMGEGVDKEQVEQAVAGAWSMVHGFAHLALDGALGTPDRKGLKYIMSTLLPGALACFEPKGAAKKLPVQ